MRSLVLGARWTDFAGHETGFGGAVRDDELQAFVADARARISADDRRRRRWLGRQLDDDRTFAAACAHAREVGAEVRVDMVGGRVHRGRLVASAADVLVVATDDGATAYIALTAVVALRTRRAVTDADGSLRDRTGSRAGVTPAVDAAGTLADVVGDLADRGVTADIGVVGGARYRGRISAAGRDVVTLGDDSSLRLAMVTDVVAAP